MAESLRSIMGTKKSLTRRSPRAQRKRPEKKTSLTKRQLILRLNAAVDRHALERLNERESENQRTIRADFEAAAKLARARAKIAWRRGKKAQHSKMCATARVCEMAASKFGSGLLSIYA